jgi:hypothetical protein
MSAPAVSTDVLVIGYGSLMSGLGLLQSGPLRVRAAVRIALHHARRGFGKFSQHGDRFAMVLEPVGEHQPIEARTVSVTDPPGEVPEGIGLLVQGNDLAQLCDREGYSGGAARRLRDEATQRGQDLAAFLWTLLADTGFDTPRFRQRLFSLVGYTSPHYLPHPVRLDEQRFALTFLAPGREGTGSARIVPVRVRTGNESLMTVSEAWRRKPNRTQLSYFVTCLLAGVHGVCIGDILDPLAHDPALAQHLRTAVAAEQRQELRRFLDMTGLDQAAYWEAFGPPTHAVRRSGLEQFLRG